jgi:hypothetical protein
VISEFPHINSIVVALRATRPAAVKYGEYVVFAGRGVRPNLALAIHCARGYVHKRRFRVHWRQEFQGQCFNVAVGKGTWSTMLLPESFSPAKGHVQVPLREHRLDRSSHNNNEICQKEPSGHKSARCHKFGKWNLASEHKAETALFLSAL